MVILFSNRKSKTEREIIEILKNFGAMHISDNSISDGDYRFTVISLYKKTDLKIKKGIAIFSDDTQRFEEQYLPFGITGICEENNKHALNLFCKNKIPVITCGMGAKNTVTLSSLNNENLLISLQRTITETNGKSTEPAEFKINLKKQYEPFSVMASVAVLLLLGIFPTEI